MTDNFTRDVCLNENMVNIQNMRKDILRSQILGILRILWISTLEAFNSKIRKDKTEKDSSKFGCGVPSAYKLLGKYGIERWNGVSVHLFTLKC